MPSPNITDGTSAPESTSQLIVALAIVVGLVVLGLALLLAGWALHDLSLVSGGVGTIIGALATALNAPTGIGKVLAAAKQPAPEAPSPSPQVQPAPKE